MVKAGREGGFPQALGQEVKITAITKGAYPSGTTDVTFTPALRWDYATSLRAHVAFIWGGWGGFIANAGVEDLTVTHNTPSTNSRGGADTIRAEYAANCWIKNVESADAGRAHIGFYRVKNMEVRHCNLHSGWQPTGGGGGGGYGVVLEHSSDSLIEDNILSGTLGNAIMAPLLIGAGSNGNVISYNYIPMSAMIGTNLVEETASHSGFPMFNLFEGNVGQKFAADNYHGGSRYQTVFRNWFKGTQTGATGGRICVGISEENLYYNIIGNVLGSADFTSPAYNSGAGPIPPVISLKFVYSFGWASTTGQYRYYNPDRTPPTNDLATDVRVASTTIIHGNWTAVDASNAPNAGQIWDGSIEDHGLPNSYYLTSKPNWFGNLTWPPINPASGIPASEAIIPAAYRFINGGDPSGGQPSAPAGLRILP